MYTRIAQLRTPEQFSEHIRSLGIVLDFDPELLSAPESPLAQPYHCSTFNFKPATVEPLVHSAHGRLGCHNRWQAH